MRKKIIIIIAIAFALIFCRMLMTSFGKSFSAQKKRLSAIPAVTVDTVQTRNVTREFIANARVVAKYRVSVLARISGYLTKSYFKEGDYVKTGQVLFEIEPQEYLYALGKAKANLDNIKSQSAYYEKQLLRYKELVTHDYVAKSEYDRILAQRDAYNAQVDNALSAYRDAQRNYSYTKIKTPVDGRVGIIDVTVGNYVTASSGALTTINSSNPMYITFPVNSQDYAELVRIDGGANIDRDVEFTFSSGKKYHLHGIQDFHDNKIDETTGTITLRATFPNPNDELIQGDFGTVKIFSKCKDDVPVIPQSATQENQEGVYVYLLDEKNLPRLKHIKIMGQTNDGMWLISEGLKQGDKIITSGLQKVVPGNSVKIVSTLTEENTTNKSKSNFITKIWDKIHKFITHKR